MSNGKIRSHICISEHDMDETYDEDNVMTTEEHLLLNTIMLLEKNPSLNNIGNLDEIYLTKLAVATIDNSALTDLPYNSIQKRDLVNKNKSENTRDTTDINKELNITEGIKNKPILVTSKKLVKLKGFVGRPKSYDLEDLNEQNNHESNGKKSKCGAK